MRVRVRLLGSFHYIKRFFSRAENDEFFRDLDQYAQYGLEALASATPMDTGKTAQSWEYEIESTGLATTITWSNTSMTYQGDNIVIMLQYGHGTGTGGYVKGYDFINPTLQPIFDEIADGVWEVICQ